MQIRPLAGLLCAAACTWDAPTKDDTGPDTSAAACQPVPEGREPGPMYAANCEEDADCGEGYRCIMGAAGGYYHFYDLTCTPECQTDDDCPIVADPSCGEGEYCTMVSCGSNGYCVEDTCA